MIKVEIKYIFLMLILFSLFTKTAISQAKRPDELYKFPLKAIYTYCQSEPDTFLSIRIFSYDTLHRLNLISSYSKYSADTNYDAFAYNETGLITSKTSYDTKTAEPKGKWKYKYDENNRLIFEGAGEENMDMKNVYTYNEKGQLIESTDECNYNHWHYGYEYDEQGRLILKYLRGGTEPIEYKYLQNKLTKEIHHNSNQQTEISYEYDEKGMLLTRKENDKVIEKNIYNNGLLTEQWTYYFGDDPGFSPCRSQYILKYEYY